jgi:hypothetical protein
VVSDVSIARAPVFTRLDRTPVGLDGRRHCDPFCDGVAYCGGLRTPLRKRERVDRCCALVI